MECKVISPRQFFVSLLVGLFSLNIFVPANASAKSNWSRYHGQGPNGPYRFVVQYAKTEDGKLQRVDFTYSKTYGLQLFITTRFIADEVIVSVDGKEYKFNGGGAFHKMSFAVSEALLKALRRTKGSVLVKERYEDSGASYASTLDTTGLSAAIDWVLDIEGKGTVRQYEKKE